jgi:hypothetical protein
VLGTISATALFGPLGGAALAQGTGGIKLTLLFTPPKDPVASTKYYLETHAVVADVPNFADPGSITGFASLIGA